MPLTGVSYREPLTTWIDAGPSGVDFLEILADVFVRPEMANVLERLSARFPLAMRSTSISLATPGPLRDDVLAPVVALAEQIKPLWISEPAGFCRTDETELGRFCPPPPTDDSVAVIADHAREVSERCGCPVLLENFASPLRFRGPMSEPEFLNRLCERSRCGLLLDITALFIDSRNHAFDAEDWLDRVDPAHIAQLHVAGYSRTGDRWHDRHDAPVQAAIWDLVHRVRDRSPGAGAILEHDIDIPAIDIVESEFDTLRQISAAA